MIEIPQVVTIAGIDSSGGAGINADLKTFHNQRVYAATVVTGITAQNTQGVQAIEPTQADIILAQFKSIFTDLDITAAKTGALFDQIRVQAVIDGLHQFPVKHLVVDPVMVAKGGVPLLETAAIELVKYELIPLAEVITPNLAEAEVLLEREIKSDQEMERAAKDLQNLGAQNVLVKGGHQAGTLVRDLMLFADGTMTWYEAPRIATNRTHGTGDTLAAFIVAGLARDEDLAVIMPRAKMFMNQAIQETIRVGHGHGPLNHWVTGEK
ncbi:bifunctional hydroxymethylpyrimidine kinase/phosphomethylpyrimidine kinase [Weissella coleopterorum]|uniref:Hydroxymethylpyrimidine/phosphomethylpyrimidine kinase n=1 Tax=Weissella coleopterorum TaxID=2714949 RepID=A0A6G8AZI0_9LACO|nr:bifunctional hydroxymethylpyrimidine kinase/phosphomethylpyrimidine kinase [Weissella coleopterorum]QIL50283.1 bifunctional hydroxymethylpyrimidine kinase/phosphomethylpyrimidine kinase [Weissella coleopterorum]